MKNKKALKVVFSILSVIVFIVAGFFILNAVAINKYWAMPADPAAAIEFRENKIDSDLEAIALVYDEYEQTDEMIISHLKNGQKIEGYDDIFDYYNNLLTTYFMDNYNIDVSERLEKLTAMTADWPLDTGIVGCYFDATPEHENNFYVCTEIFGYTEYTVANMKENGTYTPEAFAKEDYEFTSTYIHEAIHYLGIMGSDYTESMGLVEGLTEYVTSQVLIYSGFEHENSTAYNTTIFLAEQIAEADKELIPNVIKAERKFDFNAYINNILGNEYADEYSMYLDFITITQIENDGEYKFMAQYFTYELLKSMSVCERPENTVIPFFELLWMVN